MEGEKEDDKIEQRGGNRLRDVEAQRVSQVGRGESPAPAGGTRSRRQVPHGLYREAGHPSKDAEEDAPDGDEADQILADEPPPRALAEQAEILEKEGKLDGGQGDGIGDAANVKDLMATSASSAVD